MAAERRTWQTDGEAVSGECRRRAPDQSAVQAGAPPALESSSLELISAGVSEGGRAGAVVSASRPFCPMGFLCVGSPCFVFIF